MKKIVLISGGTSGLGRSTMQLLLSQGFFVATFSPDTEDIKSLRKDLAKQYPKDHFLVMKGDVTREKDIARIVKKTKSYFGNIDILINNAGIGYFPRAEEVDIDRFKLMQDINVTGNVMLTKHVVPLMKKRKRGQIITISSISGKRAHAKGECYSATKFALIGFSQGLRDELRHFGIKVATICPGMMDTPFFKTRALQKRKKERSKHFAKMLHVEDVTRLVLIICTQSEQSDIQDMIVMPFGEQ